MAPYFSIQAFVQDVSKSSNINLLHIHNSQASSSLGTLRRFWMQQVFWSCWVKQTKTRGRRTKGKLSIKQSEMLFWIILECHWINSWSKCHTITCTVKTYHTVCHMHRSRNLLSYHDHTIRHDTIRCNTIRHDIIPFNTKKYDTIRDTKRCNTIQYNTTRWQVSFMP